MLILASTPSYASGIMVISNVDIPPYQEAVKGFRERVGLPVRQYYLGAGNEHVAEVREAIDRQKPELFFALGKQALEFCRKLKSPAPIVMAFVLHPEDRRGRVHESGVSMVVSPYRQLQLLLQVVPGVRKVGVVYDPQKSRFLIQQFQMAAKRLGIELRVRQVNTPTEASRSIGVLMHEVDAFWMVPDTTALSRSSFRQLLELSLQRNIPLLGFAKKHARAGALLASGFDNRRVGAQAGVIALRLLKGGGSKRKGSFLSPDYMVIAINKRTAEIMGLEISESIYRRADVVYE